MNKKGTKYSIHIFLASAMYQLFVHNRSIHVFFALQQSEIIHTIYKYLKQLWFFSNNNGMVVPQIARTRSLLNLMTNFMNTMKNSFYRW